MLVQLTSNFAKPEDEDVKHLEADVRAVIRDQDLGKGTLFVAKSRLSWLADDGQGFALDYRSISLHAISRDLTHFPSECLYLMVENEAESDAAVDTNSGSESGDDEGNGSKIGEVRFVPGNRSHLDPMFKAMSECQLLHPDPNDSISEEDDEDDDEDDLYEDAEESGDGAHCGVEYDVAAAERLMGAPAEVISTTDNGSEYSNGNGNGDEPMEVAAGQFEDAEPEH